MEPDYFFHVLSDQTRLRALMLIEAEGELCVCELTHALGESQPKISRHLALMREAGAKMPLWQRSSVCWSTCPSCCLSFGS